METTNETTPTQESKINLGSEIHKILELTWYLNGRYGAGYLANLLQGTPDMVYRKPEHGTLPSVGVLHNWSLTHIRDLIYALVRKGALTLSAGDYPLVRMTKSGEAFLQSPSEYWVPSKEIFPSKMGLRFLKQLRAWREKVAENSKCNPRDVLPDITLHHLIFLLPENQETLLQAYGIGPVRLRKYGQALLNQVILFRAEEKERTLAWMLKITNRPTYQDTLQLFKAGMSPEEISLKKGVKASTIRNYLEKLHLCGQINLRPWIEQQMDRKTLYIAVKFFSEAEDKRLTTASMVLGLEIEILRWCRIYMIEPGTWLSEAA
jgi:ATP-dependent DNA helicase RecQ